jgi:hypothetical protein
VTPARSAPVLGVIAGLRIAVTKAALFPAIVTVMIPSSGFDRSQLIKRSAVFIDTTSS